MSTDHTAFDAPVWGSPQPGPRRWGVRETATAIGIAAVIAGFGGAAIYAASGSSSEHLGPAAHQAFGPPGGPGGSAGAPGPMSPDEPALHGQFVVTTPQGFTTVLTQNGTVTAVSPTSITVRSRDGFSQTYATSSMPDSRVHAVDESVMVRAVQDGGPAPALPQAVFVIDAQDGSGPQDAAGPPR
jgi:hypothetical protein